MRKISLILVIIFVFMLFTPISIHALPDSDYNTSFSLDFFDINAGGGSYYEGSPIFSFDTGTLYSFDFTCDVTSSISGSIKGVFKINLDIKSPADVFLFYKLSDGISTYTYNLSLVHSADGQFDTSDIHSFDPFPYSGSLTHVPVTLANEKVIFGDPYTNSSLASIAFIGLAGVLPGSYTLRINYNLSSLNFSLPFGIYVDYPLSGNDLTDYENGDITFSEAVSNIKSDLDSALSDLYATPEKKQFEIALANYKLDQLTELSDEKFSHVVDDFETASHVIVDQYISMGLTNVTPAVSALNTAYTDALTQAVTPEQGTLINSRYSLRLAQLQTVFESNYKKELDNVLSKDDFDDKQEAMDHTDELLQVESSALAIFEESEYQSYLTFVDWFHSLEDDPTVYRSIFEFFFEDARASVVQPFLIIPFSLVLVGVILATTTVVLKRGGRDG